MNADLKPLEEQVIVITGATSGIGLTTARMAADRGASLVLAARSGDALEELVDEIADDGGDVVAVVADVASREDVAEIADVAIEEFGGFDTWVNVAGVFIYGTLEETPIEDMREQFDVNVWGLLYGSLEAAEHLRDRGGVIVNVGSAVSDRAIPLQGSYSASKHAVKGFTDSLRMELEADDAPVSVTLIKPGSVDTPYPEHAKNYMEESAELPPPVYAPETVARAILQAAERPEREVTIGAGGKGISLLGQLSPRLADVVMERFMTDQQRGGRPPEAAGRSGVDESVGDLEERGDHEGHVAESSAYTRATFNARTIGAILAGLAAIVALLYARSGKSRSDREQSGRGVRRARSAEETSEPDSKRRSVMPNLD